MIMDRYDPKYIDTEEQELIRDLKKIDARTLKKPTPKRQAKIRKAAREFVQNESKMNIRIAQSELAQIKNRARKEGLKYQTLVKSILHKYVTGQLVERSRKAG
jgi:predicted DNA binding CopG/RHH family protein